MPRLIWVFPGCTGHFVGFVMWQLIFRSTGQKFVKEREEKKLVLIGQVSHNMEVILRHSCNFCFSTWPEIILKSCNLTYILFFSFNSITFEPPQDKTNQMTVCPAKTRISLGICSVWSESSLCTQWVAKDPSFPHADSENSDQTGRMPRLIWVFAGRTCHFVGFVMRQLIFIRKLNVVTDSFVNMSS